MKNWFKSTLLPALTYAGIVIGIVILHSVVMDILELQFSTYNSIMSIVLPLAGIAYAMYSFRKEYHNNTIGYSKVFGFGLLVALLISIGVSGYNLLYTFVINPDFLELSRQMMEERMLGRGADPEMIERALESQENLRKPLIMFVISIAGLMLWSLIFTLIAAAVIKKEPKEPFEGVE